MADPVEYLETTEDGYAAAFAEGCVASPSRRGVLLRGRCPRCDDVMHFPVVTEVFQTITVPGTGTRRQTSTTKRMLCTCEMDHPGRPAGDEGCGGYWNVTLSWQS